MRRSSDNPLTLEERATRREFLEATRRDVDRFARAIDAAETDEERDGAIRQHKAAVVDLERLERLGSQVRETLPAEDPRRNGGRRR